MTKIINVNHPDAFILAAKAIENQDIISFPTDTVYGIGVSVHDSAAIDKIFQAKVRNPQKAIPVLVGDLNQLLCVSDGLTPIAQKLSKYFWPGALTLVIPRKQDLPANLSPYPTIGVRMPDHSFALEMLRHTGPLAATSANISGGKDPVTPEEVLIHLQGRIALLFDGGKTPGSRPSTVVDCTGEAPIILREGDITKDQIQKILSENT